MTGGHRYLLIFDEIQFRLSGERHPPIQLAKPGGQQIFGVNVALQGEQGSTTSRHLQKSCVIHKMTTMSKKKQERISVSCAATTTVSGNGQRHDNVGYGQNTKFVYYNIVT
eukprot:XP_016659298.1 PREDICTED: uncharacterized protein LOC107883576 [Acyrthosiphon pisum]